MKTRKSTVVKTIRDDVMGGTTKVVYRAWQDVTKSGKDAKRAPSIRGKMLVIYSDGSKRFYNNNRVLAFEKVSEARFAAERAYPGAV